MTNNNILFALFSCLLVLAVAPTASAQELRYESSRSAATLTLSGDQLALDSDSYRDELASIDAESDAATGLYVTSLALAGVGVASGLVAVGAIFGSAFDGDALTVLALSSLISVSAFGLSVLALIPAIALDVDSGSRRDGLARRTVRVSASPTNGGGMAGVSGTF